MIRKIKMVALLLIIVFMQYGGKAQVDFKSEGIVFEKGLTWEQVKKKAKAEGKNIFIDCYTTWCAPCKAMEENVYHQKKVGDFINRNYISIKYQMDKTVNDIDEIRGKYKDASKIESEFSIDAYPTFLFLSTDGKPLHRAAGYFNPEKFLLVAANALDPEKQIYTLMKKYDPEKLQVSEMKAVARSYKFTCPELADKIAIAYLNKIDLRKLTEKDNREFLIEFKKNDLVKRVAQSYINTLSDQECFLKENINLFTQFMKSSKDRCFTFFYRNCDKIDEVMNKSLTHKSWFARKWIDRIIYKEDIAGYLDNSQEDAPDWNKMAENVKLKYGLDYATRNVLIAKINWYLSKENWNDYTESVVEYMENYASVLETDWGLNEYAWNVFQHSAEVDQLNKALYWSSRAIIIFPSANWMDTYANILYKLNRVKEAIIWEEVAIKLDPNNKELIQNLAKMKNSQPTWTINEKK